MTDKILIDRSVVEQALKLLDALSYDENYDYDGCFQHWADYARPEKLALQFRAALERPKPLPSTVWRFVPTTMTDAMAAVDKELRHAVPWIRWEAILAAAPQPPRQPLTDDEIERLWYQSWGGALPFARNIERIYGIGE